MSDSNRREHERHSIDWAAGYRLDSTGDWLPCRAVNMGSGGVAIEAAGLTGDEYLVGDIEMRFELSDNDPFELRGVIRHRARSHRGDVLFGIEFTGLASDDLALLDTLRKTSVVPA